MMYTSLKVESEKVARSQVELLQNQPWLILRHGNCSNGWRKYMSRGIGMNRRYHKHLWYHWNCPEHGSKQVMQQPIKRIASDLQCLKLVTSARASVASCLNIIGRKVACFKTFSADGFIRGSHCWAQGLWTVALLTLPQKRAFSVPWNNGHHHAQGSVAVRFVNV